MSSLSRAYWTFTNLIFTLEDYQPDLFYWLHTHLPRSYYAPPYCYKCRKNWPQMLDETMKRLRIRG